jgi:hypothetical protein
LLLTLLAVDIIRVTILVTVFGPVHRPILLQLRLPIVLVIVVISFHGHALIPDSCPDSLSTSS